MASRIHTPRQAAENDQAACRKITGQAFRHARAVGCRMPRANQCDPWARDHLGITAYVEDQRWVIDLLKLSGISRVLYGNQTDASGTRAIEFLLCQFQGAASAQRLCRNRLNSGSFKFGKGRLEDGFDASQSFDETSGFCGT